MVCGRIVSPPAERMPTCPSPLDLFVKAASANRREMVLGPYALLSRSEPRRDQIDPAALHATSAPRTAPRGTRPRGRLDRPHHAVDLAVPWTKSPPRGRIMT